MVNRPRCWIVACTLAFAAPALVVPGCAVNPVSQQPEVIFVSEEQEVEAGREAAKEVAAEMGIVEDARLQSYVSDIGKRVAAHAPARSFEYKFVIVDLPEPNAFALPGGHVYVSRGILAIANDEDELANVLAHEVVHVAARHHAQRQARATGVGLLALPGLLVGALIPVVGDLVAAPFALAGIGALASYSREQEREADRIGQQMSAAAGYDPAALASFLNSLDRETDLLVEEPRNPSFFDTHPTTPSRAADAAKNAGKHEWSAKKPIAGNRAGFLQRIDGVMLGVNPAEGVFEGQLFLHPDMGFAVRFPEEWKAINTRRAVGAVSKKKDAQVVLQLAGKGDDPREAASVFLNEVSQKTRIDVARLDAAEINGLRAVRGQAVAAGRGGTVSLDMTWIAHRGLIFQLMGVVGKGYSDAHRSAFAGVAESFRPLQASERQRIQETRLRLRAAKAGESLAAFGQRTGNVWSVEQTAVANALTGNAVLSEGQLLKIAVEQPYPGSPQ